MSAINFEMVCAWDLIVCCCDHIGQNCMCVCVCGFNCIFYRKMFAFVAHELKVGNKTHRATYTYAHTDFFYAFEGFLLGELICVRKRNCYGKCFFLKPKKREEEYIKYKRKKNL